MRGKSSTKTHAGHLWFIAPELLFKYYNRYVRSGPWDKIRVEVNLFPGKQTSRPTWSLPGRNYDKSGG